MTRSFPVGWTRLDWCFAAAWLFVVFVSVYDGYLVLTNRHLMLSAELNPFGLFLIKLNRGRVWYLLAAKCGGTILACSVMLLLYWRKPRVGMIVAGALAALQLALLLFLVLN